MTTTLASGTTVDESTLTQGTTNQLSAKNPTFTAVTDSAPQLDTGMRTQSTSNTSETTLYTTTTTLAGTAVIFIAGHATVGGTASFWVRATNSSGTIITNGTTTSLSATQINMASIPVANGAVYVWDASTSSGSDTAVIDGTLTAQKSSFFLVGRYVSWSAGGNNPSSFLPIIVGNCSALNYQLADSTATVNVQVATMNQGNYTHNVGGETTTYTFTISPAAQIIAAGVPGTGIGAWSAQAITVTGDVFIIT